MLEHSFIMKIDLPINIYVEVRKSIGKTGITKIFKYYKVAFPILVDFLLIEMQLICNVKTLNFCVG